MTMALIGLSQLNIELSSRCDRATLCAFCGHQDRKSNPHLKFGDIDFDLLRRIRNQVAPPTVISFHRDGDPLVYPLLQEALMLFAEFPTSLVTHGETLSIRAKEIIGRATTITVSVIPNDRDRELQLESIRSFLNQRGDLPPVLQLKFVGAIENPQPYEALGVRIINRALHNKRGNWNYVKAHPIAPEIGVCLDFLGRPTIDWRGRVFICNRLDTEDAGLIGDLNKQSLDEIWNGPVRARMLKAHLAGRRDLANALCARCESWGIPTASGL